MKSTARFTLTVLSAACAFAANTALAQEPTKVDAKHYKVVAENDQVRVLRITYGPHEKSSMHEHPAGVVTFLTDSKMKFTFPDGKTADSPGKPGDVLLTPAGKHLPENMGDKPFEAILVELKGKPAAHAPAPAATPAPAKAK